jgi:hypothetical protein
MFGVTVGMRRAAAFVEGKNIAPLRKPPFWVKDSQQDKILELLSKTRINIRRSTARLVWTMFSHFYKYNTEPLNISQELLERRAVNYIKNMIYGITAAYKIREYRARLLKLSGVDYEKVKNAETVENRWI